MKIFNFLPTLFGNKDFISRESPILADFKNIIQLFTFSSFFYNDQIPLSNILRSQKKIKFPSLLIKLWALIKNSLHNKKLDFN